MVTTIRAFLSTFDFRLSTSSVCLLCALLGALQAHAQAYPSRPIRLVVPFPPGASPNDITGRLLGKPIGESLGQQVVVDNRAGAGGIIGTDVVAKANPDGYTLLVSSTTLTTSPNLYRKLPYDVARDLQPITLISSAPMLVFVHPSVPANNAKEFIAWVKSKPGQVNFSSGGSGTVPHFAGEMLNSMAGIKMSHVPYKGGAPASAALLAGEVSVYIDTPTAMLPFAQQGRVRRSPSPRKNVSRCCPTCRRSTSPACPATRCACGTDFSRRRRRRRRSSPG